jgi:hypothetical protein
MAHRIVAYAGGFGILQNPMKFLPYFGGPAVGILRAPKRPAAHRRELTLVAQWRQDINSSQKGLAGFKEWLVYQYLSSLHTQGDLSASAIALIGVRRGLSVGTPRVDASRKHKR